MVALPYRSASQSRDALAESASAFGSLSGAVDRETEERAPGQPLGAELKEWISSFAAHPRDALRHLQTDWVTRSLGDVRMISARGRRARITPLAERFSFVDTPRPSGNGSYASSERPTEQIGAVPTYARMLALRRRRYLEPRRVR